YWDFIAFKHNEHQVARAKALSEALGFERFAVRKTSRFWRGRELIERTPIRSREGQLEYYLEPPSKAEFLHDGTQDLVQLGRIGETYQRYLDETAIDCKVLREKQIFITAEGLAFPCGWLATIYHAGVDRERHQIWRRLQALPEGKDSLNALRIPLEE